MQVWTLTLTGCVRQGLGSHRVGDSLKHHLLDDVARLMPCAQRKENYSHLGRRDERIEEMPFSRAAEMFFLEFHPIFGSFFEVMHCRRVKKVQNS